MTSEQPDKFMYCKIENNQITTFVFQNSDFFRTKFELCLEIAFYASRNWNYQFFRKFWIKLYIPENLPLIHKNKCHVISLFASNNV